MGRSSVSPMTLLPTFLLVISLISMFAAALCTYTCMRSEIICYLHNSASWYGAEGETPFGDMRSSMYIHGKIKYTVFGETRTDNMKAGSVKNLATIVFVLVIVSGVGTLFLIGLYLLGAAKNIASTISIQASRFFVMRRILNFLVMFLIILAWALFAIRLPSASCSDLKDNNSDAECKDGPEESFWGGSETSGYTYSWGPGIGWYLTIIPMVLIAASGVVGTMLERH